MMPITGCGYFPLLFQQAGANFKVKVQGNYYYTNKVTLYTDSHYAPEAPPYTGSQHPRRY
jgi:hypothetical protein